MSLCGIERGEGGSHGGSGCPIASGEREPQREREIKGSVIGDFYFFLKSQWLVIKNEIENWCENTGVGKIFWFGAHEKRSHLGFCQWSNFFFHFILKLIIFNGNKKNFEEL